MAAYSTDAGRSPLGEALGAKPTPSGTLGDPLLDAAARLMSRPGGMARTTLQEIAVEASAPVEQVLRRFPTLDHAAACIFEEVFRHLPQELGDEVDEPLEDRLYALLANDFARLAPYKDFVRAISLRTLNPLTPSFMLQAPLAARYAAYVSEQIRTAREHYDISRWTVPTLAAGAFWLVRMEALRFWMNDRSSTSAASMAHAHQLTRTFVKSLGGRPRNRRSLRREGQPARPQRYAGPPVDPVPPK
jgi:AcrR family transcriptional regulator